MKTIMAIDDDPNVLKLLKINLMIDGYQVVTVSNPATAAACFEKAKPDLVLLDLMMPGIDGMELLDIIRGTSKVPIIILSARSDTPSIQKAMVTGADDYITKPFNFKLLRARIATKIRRS